MKTWRVFPLLVVLLLPDQAWAHRHKKEFTLGASDDEESTLPGVELSFAKVFPPAPNGKNSYFVLFTDFGANRGWHEGADRTRLAFTVGGRLVFPLGDGKRFQFFVHGMLSGVRTKDSAPSAEDWAFGPGLGGGLDRSLTKRDDRVYARVQADYVWLTWSEGFARRYLRYTAALVIRFPEEKERP